MFFDNKYLRNIRLQGAGNISAQIINILTLPIITRLYSPTDIGSLKIFIEVLAVYTILISFRVERVVMLPKHKEDASNLASFVFSCGILSALTLTLVTFLAVIFDLIPDDFIIWSYLLPITSFILVTAYAFQQLSQRTENFMHSGLSEVVNRSTNSFISIFAGLLNFGGIALGFAVLSGAFTKTLTFYKFLYIINLRFFESLKNGVGLIKKAGYQKILGSIMISEIMLAITTLAPLWYISYKWGGEYLGHFSLVLATLVLPTTLIGRAIGQVYFQRASSLISSDKNFRQLFLSNFKFLTLFTIPITVVVYFFADYLYPLIFGEQWILAGTIAKYYVFATAFGWISIPLEKSAVVTNAWWYSPLWYLFRIITTFLLIYLIDVSGGSFLEFIFCLTIQVAFMYCIDIYASYKFSLRTKPFPSNIIKEN